MRLNMKIPLKFFMIVTVLLIVFSLILLSLPVNASGALFEHTYDLTSANSAVEFGGNTIEAQTFTPANTFELTSVKIRIWHVLETGTIKVLIYDTTKSPDEQVGSSTSINTSDLPSNDGTLTEFNILSTPILVAGRQYAILVVASVANSVRWQQTTSGFSGGDRKDGTGSTTNWETTTSTIDFMMATYGNFAPIPRIITKTATFNKNLTILGGFISSFGLDNSLHAYIEYGNDTSYGITIDCGNIASGNGNFTKNLTLDPATYQYRAYIVSNAYGTIYGANKQFVVSAYSDMQLQTLDADDITFTTARVGLVLLDLGTHSQADVSIQYSDDGGATWDESSLVDDTTDIGDFYWDISGLTNSTVYSYRAKAVDTDTYYGSIKQFSTLNPNQPPVVQGIQGLLTKWGLGGTAVWWFITALLCVAVWFVEPLRERPWLAIIVDLLIIGGSIMMSLIDIWLVVLLAGLLGLGIIGFIWKRQAA